ncbi:MAG: elongation factor P maturation arginine rhamnosyltransferase EarP [Candidatus Altimarinota bacterium]
MHQIDFLTTIIDNFGDAGFAFHLAISLLYNDKNLQIRFFCDDKELFLQLKGNLEIQNLTYYDLKDFEKEKPSQIIYNFFDRKINFEYLHSFSYDIKLINFSYFLMHDGVKNLHNTSYQSKNVQVTHYIPSLLPEGGGVIISPQIEIFSKELEKKGIEHYKKELFPHLAEDILKKDWVSVFCYRETFEQIRETILQDSQKIYLVFQHPIEGKNIINMPFLNILEYEKLLHICQYNIVRGENSLVAAIGAKKPFLWDIYKEHNEAHKYKIEDFISFLRQFGEHKEYFEIFRIFNSGDDIGNGLRKMLLLEQISLFSDVGEYMYQNAHLLKKGKKEV